MGYDMSKMTLNSAAGAQTINKINSAVSKEKFGAQVITSTLDTVNRGKAKFKARASNITPSYETQKAVLSAGLAAKGGIINSAG